MSASGMMVFTGNSNPELSEKIVEHLNLPLGKAIVGQFSDGEVMVEVQENVRGRDVFVVQSTSAPTNDNLMELLVMVDAARRASAARITAVVPYFGFARQDRRPRASRVPITAKLVAKMFGTAGVDRVLTIDLHADQIQGYFDIAVDNVYASPILLADVWKQKYKAMVVVSPDVGGVVRARALAKRLGDADLALGPAGLEVDRQGAARLLGFAQPDRALALEFERVAAHEGFLALQVLDEGAIGALVDVIDAGTIFRGGGGADIGPLMRAGVPGLGLRTVGEHYFDWHHTVFLFPG